MAIWRPAHLTPIPYSTEAKLPLLSADDSTLITLRKVSARTRISSNVRMGPPHSHYTEATVKYVLQHLRESIEIREISRMVMQSTFIFIRRFSRETGMTPYEFVRRARIAEASALLEYSSRSVHTISLAVGYRNAASFTRAFVEIMGETPTSYRSSTRRSHFRPALRRSAG